MNLPGLEIDQIGDAHDTSGAGSIAQSFRADPDCPHCGADAVLLRDADPKRRRRRNF
jgi:hypothetical protein